MKGVIFSLFEQFVVENWGTDTFEEILDECELATEEPFVGPGTYPDEDLLQIVGKAVEKLGIPLSDGMRAFGKWVLPRLMEQVPKSMTNFDHPKQFLQTVHDIIHVEVRKLYSDAEPPRFTYKDPAPDRLIMIYQSPRKMYDLMDGLIEGVAEYYDCPIDFKREIKQEQGEELAEYELTFGA